MKYAVSILNWVKLNKILAFVLIGAITYSLSTIFKAKKNCEDCTPYQRIAEDLIEAFKDKETAYDVQQSAFHFAVYSDTLKPMTRVQWKRYRDSTIRVNQRKLDSLKLKKTKL